MAELKHPHAGAYRKLRRFFDQLRYASNASARQFSFRDTHNRSEFWAPELTLSWTPTGALSVCGRVYPSHGLAWTEYIHLAAEHRWKGAQPELDPGRWYIHTSDPDLAFKLSKIQVKGQWLFERDRHCLTSRHGLLTPAAHREIVGLLRLHQAPFILPRRTAADDLADQQETAPRPAGVLARQGVTA